MLVVGYVEGSTDAPFTFVGAQQTGWLGHAALAVDPAGLDGIEPRTLGRQEAGDDADAVSPLLYRPVVLPQPVADLLAQMPAGVIPDQQQRRLAPRCEPRTTPVQEGRRQRTGPTPVS